MAGPVCSIHKVGTEGKNHTPECGRRAKLLSQLKTGATGGGCNAGAPHLMAKRFYRGEARRGLRLS